MLQAYYDSTLDTEIWEKLFMHVAIGPEIRKAKSKGEVFCSAQKHLCLLFNLHDVQWGSNADGDIGRSIDSYCCKVLQQFAKKHHTELGFGTFAQWERSSVTHMIERIVSFVSNSSYHHPMIFFFPAKYSIESI